MPTAVITPEVIARAKKIRSKRDKRYGNIFKEEATDARWVGEVGEISLNAWLKTQLTIPVLWITDDAAGKPDFRVGNVTVGAKTVKRQVPPRAGYTAQITAKHAEEPVDHFFFMSYCYPTQTIYLCGGISKSRFMNEAQYYGAGDQVHKNYTIREGHEIYNIDLGNLVPPKVWVKALVETGEGITF